MLLVNLTFGRWNVNHESQKLELFVTTFCVCKMQLEKEETGAQGSKNEN